MKLSEYIRKSWDYISTPDKWIKHAAGDGNGRYCSIGALSAYGESQQRAGELTPDEARAMYNKAVLHLSEVAGRSIVQFNDDSFTNHAAIAGVWETTAAKLEATGH